MAVNHEWTRINTNKPSPGLSLCNSNSRLLAYIRGFIPLPPNCAVRRSGLGSGFRHHPDFLREGDEARVVLVGVQERIHQHLGYTDGLLQFAITGMDVGGEALLMDDFPA